LEIDRGIAFSPQFSIDPRLVPFENRWKKHSSKIEFLDSDPGFRRKGKVWVFTDTSHKHEKRHADLISASGPSSVLAVPGAFHPVGPALQEARVLDKIIGAFLNRAEDEATFRNLILDGMQGTSYQLVAKAGSKNPPERDEMFRNAIKHRPKNKNFRILFARTLIEEARYDDALEILRPLGSRVPDWLMSKLNNQR